MTWIRELSIAEERIRVVARGLSPETLAILSRKYAAFINESQEAQTTTLLELERTPETFYQGTSPPMQAQGESLAIRARGFEADWNLETNSLAARFTNDIPHVLENLLRFIVTRKLLLRGGACFHASAICHDDQESASVVMGESEAGKTTLAMIFGRERTLSDEMPAIVPHQDGWRVYATPFWGDMGWGETQGYRKLRTIFVLSGKDSFSARTMTPNQANQALLARIFNYSDEKTLLDASLSLCHELASLGAFSLTYHKSEDRDSLVRTLDSFGQA